MRIFIAHARVDEGLAHSVAAALSSEGHTVSYPDVIRTDAARTSLEAVNKAVGRANFLVFLVSPESVVAGGQCLTQLLLFRKRWGQTPEHSLPIIVRPVADDLIPASISNLGVVTPQGSVVADIANFVAVRRAPAEHRRSVITAALATVATVGLATLSYLHLRPGEAPRELPTFTIGGKDQFVYWRGTPVYSLMIDKPGTVSDYTCTLGAPTGPNIISATADTRCKAITVKTAPGPFKGVGMGFEVGGTIPFTVTADDGTKIVTGVVEVIMSNSTIGR